MWEPGQPSALRMGTAVTTEMQPFSAPCSLCEALMRPLHYDVIFHGQIGTCCPHHLQVLLEEVEDVVLVSGFPPSFHVVVP